MNLYKVLVEQLKKETIFIDENGKIKKWVIISRARNYDHSLIKLLLENPIIREKFFIEVENTTIFKQEEFISFIEMNSYFNNSYTKYKNRIGLSIDKRYLKQQNCVVLVWPYKDSVLEGGQSRDENRRDEIFFNEILAQDEITQLFEAKVLTKAKVYNRDGSFEFKNFTRDNRLNSKRGLPADTISDNLIIKGNNLLALHTLKKQFANKVKMIYIDPPYNTGSDSFRYNDSFSHSTWLTFMKNRLEVARDLLKEDGGIFIHCDDNEQAYLKVLMDEIFNRENFVANMIRVAKTGGGHDSKFLAVEYDYILFYAKNIEQLKINRSKVDINSDKKYRYADEYVNRRGKYYLRDLDYKGSYSKTLDYPIKLPSGKEIYPGGKYGAPNTWRWSKEKFKWGIENGFIVFNEERKKVYIKQYQYVDNSDKIRIREIPYRALVKSLNSEGAKELSKLFGSKVFDFPKPEGLIKYLIEILTNEGDIVLDYHLGSGTTAVVAHKMGRQYIGIEQMDYIESVSVERLKKVIDGEDGGISKELNWQGGGSFKYFELKKYNQEFIEKIQIAKNSRELLKIYEEIKEKSFLNYNVDLKREDEYIEDFKKLSIDKQKEHLVEILDKNQIYVNLSSLDDADFKITNSEKAVTKSFYNL